MKTIKVPDAIHLELKLFVAANPSGTMESTAGDAIILYLKEKGHKFIQPSKTKSKKQ